MIMPELVVGGLGLLIAFGGVLYIRFEERRYDRHLKRAKTSPDT